jgi:phasin family protein
MEAGRGQDVKAPKAITAAPAIEQPAAEAIEASIATLRETVAQENSGTEGVSAPQPAVAAVQATQAKVKQGMEKVMKTAEEFVAFSQGNVEAFVKSGQIWATGVQDLSKNFAAVAQASMEESISTMKAFASVKSLKEVFDLQAAFARAALEKTVTESSKLTDASLKLTEQTLAPLTARVTVAVEKFSKTA